MQIERATRSVESEWALMRERIPMRRENTSGLEGRADALTTVYPKKSIFFAEGELKANPEFLFGKRTQENTRGIGMILDKRQRVSLWGQSLARGQGE